MRERTIWISAGLLGLGVAVALALLTSRVAQPPVGLSGEPVSAGRALAPARTATTAPAGAQPRRPAVRTSTQAAPPPATQAPPRDDDDRGGSGDSSGSGSGHDGSGQGRGRGRGGDDD
jgi:hypothetical protein